jgi:hypothetical protein
MLKIIIGMPKNIRTPEASFLTSVIVRSWKPVTENDFLRSCGSVFTDGHSAELTARSYQQLNLPKRLVENDLT